MSENSSELIVRPEEFARIRALCQRRAAELEAGKVAAASTPTLDHPLLSSEQEAQRFAVAIDGMPPKVRRFFEREDPAPPWTWESVEDSAERRFGNRSVAGAASGTTRNCFRLGS
jgi:hypothetical protein